MRIVVGAIILGAVGFASGFVLQTSLDTDPAERSLETAVWDCPEGLVVGSYRSGSRVYATGRDESGGWVRVRDMSEPARSVWISAGDVDLDQAVDGLPVAECVTSGSVVPLADSTTTTLADTTTTEIAGSSTTTVAGTTTTAAGTTTSTSSGTTVPTTTSTTAPTTTSTTAADTTSPQISNAFTDPDEIWEEDGNSISCPPSYPRDALVSAFITDNVGVVSATVSWSIGGSPTTKPMSKVGNTYTAVFGPFEADTVPYSPGDPLEVAITIEASDAASNSNKTVVTVVVHNIGECFG